MKRGRDVCVLSSGTAVVDRTDETVVQPERRPEPDHGDTEGGGSWGRGEGGGGGRGSVGSGGAGSRWVPREDTQ